MMKIFLSIYILLLGYLPSTWANNPPLLQVSFEDMATPNKSQLNKYVDKPSINELVLFINSLLKGLPQQSIQLKFINSSDSGPYTDLDDLNIIIPYTFFIEISERLEKNQYTQKTGTSIAQATTDVILHTILHELAHAIISTYQLPVIGKEEDAADSLATFLLVEHFEEGQEIAISAADMFDFQREEENITEESYWDEHSLDSQRFYSIMCHVYGSNPKKYQQLLDNLAINQRRQDLCIDEYNQLADSWEKTLLPWIKNEDSTQ